MYINELDWGRALKGTSLLREEGSTRRGGGAEGGGGWRVVAEQFEKLRMNIGNREELKGCCRWCNLGPR